MYKYHYCNRPGDCPHLRYEDWPKGAKVARCMNPEHGDWCGRVIDYSSIGEFVRVIRPSWCHGCDGEGHLLPKGVETIPQSLRDSSLKVNGRMIKLAIPQSALRLPAPFTQGSL